jgi:hypothetical protein
MEEWVKKLFGEERWPAGRAPSAGSGHFVTGIPLRLALPMVAMENLRADWREAWGKASRLPSK